MGSWPYIQALENTVLIEILTTKKSIGMFLSKNWENLIHLKSSLIMLHVHTMLIG